MFAASFDHSFNDLFNQYVNLDPSAGGDGNKDVAFTGDLDQLFPVGSLSSDCGDLSPGGSRQFLQSPSQTWRKDAWYLQQDSVTTTDSPSNRAKTFPDSSQPSEASHLGGVRLEESSNTDPLGLLSASPSTPPATPSRKLHFKSAPITPKIIRRRETSDSRSVLRKKSSSPSQVRSAHVQKTKMAYPETWNPRPQRFNNHFRVPEDRLPLSPPPSDILVQNEHMRRDSGVHVNSSSENLLTTAAELASQYGADMYSTKHQQQQQQHGYLNHNNTTPPSADDIFQSPPSSEPQQMHAWHADALASGLQFTPDMNGNDGQWWSSPMPARVSQPQNQHAYLVSPLQHKAPAHHAVPQQNQHDLLQGGLMIDFNQSFDLSSGSDAFSSASVMHSTSAPHIPSVSSFSHNPYMAATQQHLGHQSRSPSMSPTNGSSPKSRVVMKNKHNRTHSRKLSSNSMSAPKPATNKMGTSPKHTISKSAPNVSFVNFTAHDSKKILTGVAPSGSSKTKARREQEARDRRRKLSEAALMAVRNAGGDVEALEAVLC